MGAINTLCLSASIFSTLNFLKIFKVVTKSLKDTKIAGGFKLIQNDFESIYDNYTRMMLFANSNKHKMANINDEMAAIQEAHHEILNEPRDQDELLNSINGLKTRLRSLQEEIDGILYQYNRVNEMLHQVDVMISDYYRLEIEISSYELNGMEQDLLSVKDEYKQFKLLKSEIGLVCEKISNRERI